MRFKIMGTPYQCSLHSQQITLLTRKNQPFVWAEIQQTGSKMRNNTFELFWVVQS